MTNEKKQRDLREASSQEILKINLAIKQKVQQEFDQIISETRKSKYEEAFEKWTLNKKAAYMAQIENDFDGYKFFKEFIYALRKVNEFRNLEMYKEKCSKKRNKSERLIYKISILVLLVMIYFSSFNTLKIIIMIFIIGSGTYLYGYLFNIKNEEVKYKKTFDFINELESKLQYIYTKSIIKYIAGKSEHDSKYKILKNIIDNLSISSNQNDINLWEEDLFSSYHYRDFESQNIDDLSIKIDLLEEKCKNRTLEFSSTSEKYLVKTFIVTMKNILIEDLVNLPFLLSSLYIKEYLIFWFESGQEFLGYTEETKWLFFLMIEKLSLIDSAPLSIFNELIQSFINEASNRLPTP